MKIRTLVLPGILIKGLVVASTAFGQGPLKPDITVAADGSGDFKTVQEAMASIPATNTERRIVFLKNGTYREKVRVDAPFVTLRGESRKGARLEFTQDREEFNKNPDDLGTAILNLSETASDFVLENLTVENTVSNIGPHAFTIYGKADQTVIVDCDVYSRGADTVSLWRGDSGRYYHARCDIRGAVDFVCPRGWCYITDCSLYELKSGSAAVWHDGSKDPDMKFVLRNCKLDGTSGWVLARHHADAQFYFLDCTFTETMADKPPRRVIYPLGGGEPTEADQKKNADNDKKNLWGERNYFWNCHRAGGDFAWHTNNLAAAPGSPTPEYITAAWTFAGKWNPEAKTGPVITALKVEPGRVVLTFSESVTVKGLPRLILRGGGGHAEYESGSGSEQLAFKLSADKTDGVTALDLNGGAIIATQATATLRRAALKRAHLDTAPG